MWCYRIVGETSQSLNMSIIKKYPFIFTICPILFGIKFNHVEIESYVYQGLKIQFINGSLTDISIYVLIIFLLFSTIRSPYIYPTQREESILLHIFFWFTSLITLAICFPLEYSGINHQNFIMAGYLSVALLFVHLIVERIFMTEYFVLAKEHADALAINRFTYYFFCRVKEAIFYTIISLSIIFVCFIYGEQETNFYGGIVIAVCIFIEITMQLFKRNKSKEKIELVRKKCYEFELQFTPNIDREIREKIYDENGSLLPSREIQNTYSGIFSDEYKEFININEDVNISKLQIEIDDEKKTVSITLKNRVDKINVRRDILLFPYKLDSCIVKKKVDNDPINSDDLLLIFQQTVDKDVSTKKKLQDIIDKGKSISNYIGIAVYPLSDIQNFQLNSVDKNYIDIEVYISFEYSLLLSKLSEYASCFYIDNPELDITEKNQFLVMLNYAIGKIT